MSELKCNTVFYQKGGLICEKTLKITKLQKALDIAMEAINEVIKNEETRVFDWYSDELEEARQQIKEILKENE